MDNQLEYKGPSTSPNTDPKLTVDLKKEQDPNKLVISQPERDLFKWLIGNIKDKLTDEESLKKGVNDELKKLLDTTKDEHLKKVLQQEEKLLKDLTNGKPDFLKDLHKELTGKELGKEEIEEVIHTYVLSKNFYAQDATKMNFFEQEVSKFIRGQTTDITILMSFAKEYPSWSTENKYYFIPILIVMLRDYLAGMKTQI